MSWIKEYLEKTGQGEVAKIWESSPDKKPDEFDIEKAGKDFVDSRISIFKSSDEFKKYGKEQQIVALKNYKKTLNDTVGLGLSGEEAATLDPEEFNKRLKEKIDHDIELHKNGRTAEIQEKYTKIEKEFNDFKKLHETITTDLTSKLTEAENRYKEDVARHKRESIFADVFTKMDFGKDEAHRENSKIILKTVLNERGIKYREDGTVYRGENDVVTSPDGVTVLKTLEDVIKTIGSERKLFPQANASQGAAGQAGAIPPSGDANIDKLIQQGQARLDALTGKK
ncbi:MAG: hypothetical protein WAT16_02035 [Saprospiraceae bacterium]|nr:hypothetical protein [Saprospiraceae bacterium]